MNSKIEYYSISKRELIKPYVVKIANKKRSSLLKDECEERDQFFSMLLLFDDFFFFFSNPLESNFGLVFHVCTDVHNFYMLKVSILFIGGQFFTK